VTSRPAIPQGGSSGPALAAIGGAPAVAPNEAPERADMRAGEPRRRLEPDPDPSRWPGGGARSRWSQGATAPGPVSGGSFRLPGAGTPSDREGAARPDVSPSRRLVSIRQAAGRGGSEGREPVAGGPGDGCLLLAAAFASRPRLGGCVLRTGEVGVCRVAAVARIYPIGAAIFGRIPVTRSSPWPSVGSGLADPDSRDRRPALLSAWPRSPLCFRSNGLVRGTEVRSARDRVAPRVAPARRAQAGARS
jgi:hypothetical protein